MTREALIELLHAAPFRPLEIHTSDGRSFQVSYPEQALLTKSMLVIGFTQNGRLAILPLLHISSVDVGQAA